MDQRNAPVFQTAFWGPRYWPTWFGLGFFYLVARLPLWLTMPLGAGIGRLAYVLAPARRRIAEINVALCFPELDADRQRELVRGSMRSIGINVVELSLAMWGAIHKLEGRYHIEGLEHVQSAQQQGRGVLLLACHFTTVDVAGMILGQKLKYDILYRKDPNPLLGYFINRGRERFSGETIARSDTRRLIRCLREGRVLWYAPDQDFGARRSVFAPFFGVTAATLTATARIAELGRAVVLPFSHYRDERGHYRLVIKGPLQGFPCGDEVADATRINQVVEEAVRVQPEQYFWVHRRFKTRPPGERKIYPKFKHYLTSKGEIPEPTPVVTERDSAN